MAPAPGFGSGLRHDSRPEMHPHPNPLPKGEGEFKLLWTRRMATAPNRHSAAGSRLPCKGPPLHRHHSSNYDRSSSWPAPARRGCRRPGPRGWAAPPWAGPSSAGGVRSGRRSRCAGCAATRFRVSRSACRRAYEVSCRARREELSGAHALSPGVRDGWVPRSDVLSDSAWRRSTACGNQSQVEAHLGCSPGPRFC
jgi:hypothetical protein